MGSSAGGRHLRRRRVSTRARPPQGQPKHLSSLRAADLTSVIIHGNGVFWDGFQVCGWVKVRLGSDLYTDGFV